MEQTTLVAYEKVPETFPDAKVLLVLRFGNYIKRKHRGRDGTPVVTMEVVTEGGMIVLSAVSKHLSLAPGDTDALLSILEARAALRAGGERVLEWRKGELDLKGLLDERTDADRRGAVLDFLQILVTAQQEPPEYRGGSNAAKTQEMVQMIEDLRGEESLDAVLAGAEEIAKMWGPRGYTAKNRSDGGTNSSTAYGTADAETDGWSVEMGNTRAAGRHAARSARAGTSASWARGVRWECTKCEEKGLFREEEVGKVRLPRHRKKVGHAWKCGMNCRAIPKLTSLSTTYNG
ncbi:unnamed protein product [Ectocarpus fasciculatus]